jgi:NAD(P)-dependent dehydrogenase (short-subunit alcohol dehydrogenase family)
MSFKGKSIIVTGSSGGMGMVLCEKLAQQGAKLALCSNDKERLDKQVKELTEKYNTEICAKVVDITKEEEVKDFFDTAASKIGKFDAMANLAGLSIPSKIESTEEEVYNTIMDVNVKGTFLAGKHFVPNAAKPAIIVNIGSTAAKTANPNAPLYCTAKAAVNMLSQTMLLQMGAKDIRVTTINPGGADTPFWGSRTVDKSKLMSAEDVVEVILFALGSSPRIQIHDIYFESAVRYK